MARYTGADCKRCRREKMKLFLKGSKCDGPKCPFESRPFPPGQHGRGRTKETEYLLQHREKQKARRTYGVLEKQFRGYYEEAVTKPGKTGEVLLQILESRLDNVVYRMGLGSTRAEARQLVSHRSIMVNGKVLNVPSAMLKAGDVVSATDKSKAQLRIVDALQLAEKVGFPRWVEVDPKKVTGTFKGAPDRSEFGQDINESLVVELYSK